MAAFGPLSHVCRMHAASAGLSAPRRPAKNAPVAQLDRALDYESRGQEFESLRARQKSEGFRCVFVAPGRNNLDMGARWGRKALLCPLQLGEKQARQRRLEL